MFDMKDMETFSEFVENVLKREGYEHIYFSAAQDVSWWRRFCPHTKDTDEGVCKTKVLEVEQTPLLYSREPSK